jgi:EmrB/QacA subfamily drug resistance transporter
MTPMSMAILTAAYPPSERGKALGIWSGVGGLALIIGPALGGLIVADSSWRWIFWINVPIGLVVGYLSQRRLPESQVGGKWPNPLDSILVVLWSGGIVWALSESVSPRTRIPALIVGVTAIVLAIVFVLRQKIARAPMVPLSIFKSRVFSSGAVATFLLFAAMYGVVFLLPQYFQVSTGASAMVAGLELLPWTGTLVVVSPLAGRAVDKFGEQPVAITSLLLQGIGYLWIALILSPSTPYWTMVVPLVLAGAGISMGGPALQKAVLGSVGRSELGVASGVYNVFRQFGGAVGTAVSVISFYAFGDMASKKSFAHGFTAAMIGSVVLTLVGIVCAFGLRPMKVNVDGQSLKVGELRTESAKS